MKMFGKRTQGLFLYRPLSKEEVANGTHQVITCNERAREVTVSQNVGGKQLGRSFHFDKVASALCETGYCAVHFRGPVLFLRPFL